MAEANAAKEAVKAREDNTAALERELHTLLLKRAQFAGPLRGERRGPHDNTVVFEEISGKRDSLSSRRATTPSAKAWAYWTSRPPPGFPAPASRC